MKRATFEAHGKDGAGFVRQASGREAEFLARGVALTEAAFSCIAAECSHRPCRGRPDGSGKLYDVAYNARGPVDLPPSAWMAEG